MIAKVFNTYTYTSTAIVGKPPSPTKLDDDQEVAKPAGDEASAVEQQMNSIKVIVRKLVLSVSAHLV